MESRGLVSELWRYPVKSMLGERVESAAVGERGLVGDRAYALMDIETGKVVSAKNPRRWAAMFRMRAAYERAPELGAALPPVLVELPGGSTMRLTDPLLPDAMRDILGRPVTVSDSADDPVLEQYRPAIEGYAEHESVSDTRISGVSFFDGAVVHLLTTTGLASLARAAPGSRFDARRFRPNIVVEPPPGDGFVEDRWIGSVIAIGDEVEVSVDRPCRRCVMTTLEQDDLPADRDILKTAAAEHEVTVGVYASVRRAGTVRVGDALIVRS